ncbi:MAG: IS110 family transposase [Thermoanaerobaculia bacterium]
MGNASTSYVGMDVHKAWVTVARGVPGQAAVEVWEVPNEPRAIRRLARRLLREAGSGEVSCCYEAGSCGYTLQRQLGKEGIDCEVVAPSLVPRRPGERIKTDRRDARKLVEYWRSGMLTVITPPSLEQEAVRDLVRCREDVRQDLQRSRHRLSKLLLRNGRVYREGDAWTGRHRQWLQELVWETAEQPRVLAEYRVSIEFLEERLKDIDRQIAEVAQRAPYREPVGWLRCFRGIDTLSAMILLTEVHAIERFDSPRRFMAYLGLVPGEHSSGGSERRTGITKAGNTHVRRMLVEAAWHYRHHPGLGASLRRRREGQPASVLALAHRAQQRLHRRYQRLAVTLGKPTPKVVTAVARELAGFLWAALVRTPKSTSN